MSRWPLLIFRSVGQRSRSKVMSILYMLGKGGISVLQTSIFIFFISANQILGSKLSTWICLLKMQNRNLLLEIQGLNNCMFGKHKHLQWGLFFGLIELGSFYFGIYFLNVTQNYVKQVSQNIYVQHLRENSKSASTKRGNILWKRSKNENRKPTTWYCNPSTY